MDSLLAREGQLAQLRMVGSGLASPEFSDPLRMVLALFRRFAGAGDFLDSYFTISDQSIERSLWLVMSGADRGNQAEIKESPDSGGELFARQFSCSGDLILDRSAARFASRPVFRLQRRQ